MNLTYRVTAISVAAAIFSLSGLAQQSSSTLSANWQGSLKVPGQDLVVVVDLAKNAKGAWVGSFSMPELGTNDIPLDQLTVAETKVHFLLTGIPGNPSFDGSLSADGKELSGTFSASGTKTPLTFKRMGVARVKLPPPNSPLTKDFEGTWHAVLEPGNSQLRILLKLSRAADGTAAGVVVNVDQGNREVPVTSIQQKDRALDFEIRSVAVKFHGTLNAAGALTGVWTQMSATAPLSFERGGFPANSVLPASMEGTWRAALDGGENNRIVLAMKLTRAADGTAVGTLKNESEAGRELPVTSITFKSRSLEFSVAGLSATFGGTVNTAGTEITGSWIQVGTPMPVTFKRAAPAGKKP